jgi:hypothetical protein
MPKPRVFISSTYYDLRHVRRQIEDFVNTFGYEPVLFESGDIPFEHKIPLDSSCYREINFCDLFVLIIGGRYGSKASDEAESLTQEDTDKRVQYYNSITRKEYETAKSADIPIFVFVLKGVAAEYQTFRKNRSAAIEWAHVDSQNVFKLLDDIYAERRNNLVREFENVSDITEWLCQQWAGLFATLLQKEREDESTRLLNTQLQTLEASVDALRTYSEKIVTETIEGGDKLVKSTQKDLEKREKEIEFSSTDYVSHLVNSHSVPIDELKKAFSDAKNLIDLDGKIKTLKPSDTNCSYFDILAYAPFIIAQINRSRTALGKPGFQLQVNIKGASPKPKKVAKKKGGKGDG